MLDLALVALLLGLLAVGGTSTFAAGPKKDKDTYVQLLAINDFHGNLEPPTGSSGRIATSHRQRDAGGAEYLATHLEQLGRTTRTRSIVGAGDLIGASPLLSALFHDEPTIEAMNALGLDVTGVGNHEFDEGVDELLRMQNGGCHPVDGCQDGDAVPRRRLPVPGGERRLRRHAEVDPAAVRDQEVRRRQDRLHRPDARGHAADRDADRRRGPDVRRRGPTVNALVHELRRSRACTRSWC